MASRGRTSLNSTRSSCKIGILQCKGNIKENKMYLKISNVYGNILQLRYSLETLLKKQF